MISVSGQQIGGDDIIVNRWDGSVYSSKPSLCCVGVAGHLELQCVNRFLGERISDASYRHSLGDLTDDISPIFM